MKTKKDVEIDITEAITKVEIAHIGGGYQRIRAHIVGDMVVIRIKCLLTPFEKELIKNAEGVSLLKKCRICLAERLREVLEKLLDDLLNVKVISFCRDINVTAGDMFIVLGLDENIEQKFQKSKE